MKKSLLALAVAAALPGVALAQSSVTLSGNVKLGLAQTKFSNGTATVNLPGVTPATPAFPTNPTNNGSITGIADGSSRFILSGVEDLGGGLKGIFQIDQRFRGDESRPSNTADGNTFVGLAGGFGQFRVGKLDLYYGYGTDEHGIRATALQHSNISILSYVNGTTAIARASRSTNVIRYDSPRFGGVTFGLAFSPNAGGGEGGYQVPVATAAGALNANNPLGGTGDFQKGQAVQADLSYAAGPIRAGIAFWDEKTEGYKTLGRDAGQKAARIWGGYNFGLFDIGLTVDQSKFTGVNAANQELKRTAFSIPIKVNIGSGTLLFTASAAGKTKLGGATQDGTDARMYVLGYDYALSKRTSLGVSYAFLDNKANAAYAPFTGNALGSIANPTAGQDIKQLYLGIRHAF
ncbi:MAG TPA: porin [Burkholderiaceae bacterium]|nr:porin [Burkholderiaceae bacterium]